MSAVPTLLVANRGEIARRVLRTARALGWRTVALTTEPDRGAPHAAEADDVVSVPTYLDIDAIVAAAVTSGATHVHPGYGFLSERAPFARAVAEAGLVLVGPSAEVMDAMGRKDAAREIALRAGVPVVPAYPLDADPAGLDYPVLVKAAAGGGGKGMRVVRSAAEYDEGLAAARREAAAAFGDDTLLVEKYVESGRHVEVQVLGDTHGNVVHLFERDCSTQRRHQKVLEEAPAPTLTEEQRALVTSSAVALAAEVGYTSAGTVEFLLDNATGSAYFLEMNTRLQVEHPVTEEVVRVSGERVDLVALQLRIATGAALGFDQADVGLDGHAIEARVYAEDSFGGFLPQAGRATHVAWPTGVRVDHALLPGQEVSTHFDPMLGKVIAWGADREAARQALVAALDDTVILGLTTNTGFLRTLVASAQFRDAAIDTSWLDRHELPAPPADLPLALAAAALAPDPRGGPWHGDGWRSSGPPAPVRVPLAEDWVEVDPSARRTTDADGLMRAEVTVEAVGHRAVGYVRAAEVELVHQGQRHVVDRPDAFADHAHGPGDGTVTAPMPGTLLEVRVVAGQRVAEGDVLGILEAMKMELALAAPLAGTVRTVAAEAGVQVQLRDVLFEVIADE